MRLGSAAIIALACGAAHAQEGPTFGGGVGLAHRELRERTTSGATLLTERGVLASVRGTATRGWASGAALQGELGLAGGRLDYDGQTQGGTPLQTRSRQIDWTADARWRPLAPAAWGEAWLTVGWLSNQRDIAGTQVATGLQETSRAVLAGVRWASPAFPVTTGWQVRGVADARASVWHELEVNYLGLLDNSTLKAARQRELALRLVAQQSASPWAWEFGWRRLSQGQSDSALVYRNGVLFGTVRQPALRIEDLGLSLTRRF